MRKKFKKTYFHLKRVKNEKSIFVEKMNFHLKRITCVHGKATLLPDKQVFCLSEFPVRYGNSKS